MEPITENDIRFLIALNASEESSLAELRLDLRRWDHTAIDVTDILRKLIRDGVILLTERRAVSFTDYSASESVDLATSDSSDTILFLTEQGYRRWEKDDWCITTERARHLMFSQQRGSIARVFSDKPP